MVGMSGRYELNEADRTLMSKYFKDRRGRWVPGDEIFDAVDFQSVIAHNTKLFRAQYGVIFAAFHKPQEGENPDRHAKFGDHYITWTIFRWFLFSAFIGAANADTCKAFGWVLVGFSLLDVVFNIFCKAVLISKITGKIMRLTKLVQFAFILCVGFMAHDLDVPPVVLWVLSISMIVLQVCLGCCIGCKSARCLWTL